MLMKYINLFLITLCFSSCQSEVVVDQFAVDKNLSKNSESENYKILKKLPTGWGGFVEDMVIVGSTMYLAKSYKGFAIYDISDESNHVLLSSSHLGGNATNIIVSGIYAYVLTLNKGLYVFDISDPALPIQIVKKYLISSAYHMKKRGNTLFISSATNGFQSYDITDPSNPKLLAVLPGFFSAEFVIVGETAIVNEFFGVRIITVDISVPSSLSILDTYNLVSAPKSIQQIDSDHVIVSEITVGVFILDISDPEDITLKATIPEGNAYDFAINGQKLFIVNGTRSTVDVFDISTITAPSLINTFTEDYTLNSHELYIFDSMLYVTDRSNGFTSYDITDAQNEILLKKSTLFDDIKVTVMSEDLKYAYISTGTNFSILDYTDLNRPKFHSTVLSELGYSEMLVNDGKLFAVGEAVLHIYDIRTDSSSPELIFNQTIPNVGQINSLALFENYLYVGGSSGDVNILDFSDLSKNIFVSRITTPSTVSKVIRSGNYLYVANLNAGINIYNIEDPINPGFSGTYDTDGTALDLAIKGNYLYVADRHEGLVVLDVSNPASPGLINIYMSGQWILSITIQGETAYTGYSFGFLSLDISGAGIPTIKSIFEQGGSVNKIKVRENYIMVSNNKTGFYWVDFSDKDDLAFKE